MECSICTEECSNTLSCTHIAHTECIARSAQTLCPVCRKDVRLEMTPNDLNVLEESQRDRRRDAERENREAALEIAEQDDEPRRPVRRRLFYPNMIRDTSVNVTELVNMNVDQLVTEMFRLSQAVDMREANITVSAGTFRYYGLISQIRELALELGLEMEHMVDVFQLTTSQ